MADELINALNISGHIVEIRFHLSESSLELGIGL